MSKWVNGHTYWVLRAVVLDTAPDSQVREALSSEGVRGDVMPWAMKHRKSSKATCRQCAREGQKTLAEYDVLDDMDWEPACAEHLEKYQKEYPGARWV